MNRLFFIFLVSGIWLLVSPISHAIVDSNGNGASDIWERHYNSGNLFTTFDPQADSDGDGWTNQMEAISGTNPLDGNPPTGCLRPVITHNSAVYTTGPNGELEMLSPAALTITWPTLAGKKYTLLSSFDLTPGSWIPIDDDEPRISTGTDMGNAIPLTQSDGSTPPSVFLRVAISDVDSDDDDLPDFDEGFVGSSVNNADSDGDGISDAAEIAAGTNPNSRDSDGDLKDDGDDADPKEILVAWAAVPESTFALVEVDTPPDSGYAQDINDKGEVLFQGGIWESGNWIPLETPSQSSSFPLEDRDKDQEYDISFSAWHSMNNNRDLLGWSEVTFTSGQAAGGDGIYTVSSRPSGQSPYHLTESINPNLFVVGSLEPLGIANSGRCFVKNGYREPITGQDRSRIAVVDAGGGPVSFLTPSNGHFVTGNHWHFDVSDTGAIAINTTSNLYPGNTAASYQVAMWDSQLNQLSLPPETAGWHYPLHLADLPNGKTALAAKKMGDGGGSVYIQSTAGAMIRIPSLSGKNVNLLAGDGTAVTSDNKLWRNGKLTAVRDLSPRYGALIDEGYHFYPIKANRHGSYLMQSEDPQGNPKTFAALPVQLVSRDKFLAGSFRIPESYTHLEIEFGGHEDLGRYGDLLGGGTTKVYDSVDQILRNTNGSTDEQPADQKVWFVKDSTDPRKINFYTCFSTIGKVEIKLHLNNGGSAQPTVVTHQLITAPDFAPIISYVDRWVKGSSFTGQWANTTWLAMNTTAIDGPLANETRSCLIPFFDIISQVTGFTPLVMGLCDGIRMGIDDDIKFAALLTNLTATSQGWLQAQAIAEVLRWNNDPKVRYNQLKEILNDLCRIVVLPHLSDLGETFTTWEGFRKKAWRVWETARGVDKMLRVVPLASMGYLADAAIEWGNDFCTRMLSGAEKTAWDTTTWNRTRLTSGSLVERNMVYYTFGYTFGYLGEQVASGALTAGTFTVAKALIKADFILIGKLAPRTLAVVAMRSHYVKEALISLNLMDDGVRLAYEQMMASAAREPTSTLIKETSASLMESRMANQAFDRSVSNFKEWIKTALKDGNVRKLIAKPGGEAIFAKRTSQLMHLLGDQCDAITMKNFMKVAEERVIVVHPDGVVDEYFEGFFRAFEGNSSLIGDLAEPIPSLSAGAKTRLKAFLSDPDPGYLWKIDDPVFVDGVPQIPQNYWARGVLGELDVFNRVYKKQGFTHAPSAEGYDIFEPVWVQIKTTANPSSSGNIAAMQKAIVALVEKSPTATTPLKLHILKKPGTDSLALQTAMDTFLVGKPYESRFQILIEPYNIGPQ